MAGVLRIQMDDFLLWPAADIFKWTISSWQASQPGQTARPASQAVTKWTLIRIFAVELINVDFDTYFHERNAMSRLTCKFTREIELGILVKK